MEKAGREHFIIGTLTRFFALGVFGGALLGLAELPFRWHLAKEPVGGQLLNFISKLFCFSGFYGILFGLLALIGGLLVVMIPALLQKRNPAWLALFLFAAQAALMYIAVPINRKLPPLSHPSSVGVNFAMVLVAAIVAYALFVLIAKPGTGPLPSGWSPAITAFAFCLLSLVILIHRSGYEHRSTLPEATAKAGPNVILITVDTLRADHLPDWGYPHIQTPTVSSLVKKGRTFHRAFSAASWTLPSMASIMTGVTPRALHVQHSDDTLPPSVTTLASAMKESGRRTIGVSSNPFLSAPYGFDHGFDRFVSVYDRSRRSALAGVFLFDNLFRLQAALDDAANVTSLAGDQLSALKGASYFFWVHYMDPHKPYGGPWPLDIPEYGIDYNGSITFIYGWPTPINELRQPLTDDDLRRVRALYDADIQRFDRYFGKLLSALEAEGLLKNTIIALTADHGEEFLEHGDFEHGTNLHATQTHVPLIIAGSGIGPGSHEEMVSLPELAPTLCELAGIKPPPTMTAPPLLPVPMTERKVLSEMETKGRSRASIRFVGDDGRVYALLFDRDSGGRKLFDITENTAEDVDMSEEKPEITEAAFTRLKEAIAKQNKLAEKIPEGGKVRLYQDQSQTLKGLGYVVQ